MIILDTDHFTVLRYPEHSQYGILSANIRQSADRNFATTAVSVEEPDAWVVSSHPRGAAGPQSNSLLHAPRRDDSRRQQVADSTFQRTSRQFETLRKQRIRIGTQDLKIASIALEADALLLSANLRDFERVPDLRVENWLSQ